MRAASGPLVCAAGPPVLTGGIIAGTEVFVCWCFHPQLGQTMIVGASTLELLRLFLQPWLRLRRPVGASLSSLLRGALPHLRLCNSFRKRLGLVQAELVVVAQLSSCRRTPEELRREEEDNILACLLSALLSLRPLNGSKLSFNSVFSATSASSLVCVCV